MLNNFLFQFLYTNFLDSQHGFIKGKGTLTAWRDIFNKVIKARNIYECDLRQFFPSISHAIIEQELVNAGLPRMIIKWIDKINCNTPILPKIRLLDESETLFKESDLKNNPIHMHGSYKAPPFEDNYQLHIRTDRDLTQES
jgi:hypothetical protein